MVYHESIVGPAVRVKVSFVGIFRREISLSIFDFCLGVATKLTPLWCNFAALASEVANRKIAPEQSRFGGNPNQKMKNGKCGNILRKLQ